MVVIVGSSDRQVEDIHPRLPRPSGTGRAGAGDLDGVVEGVEKPAGSWGDSRKRQGEAGAR
eukprot:765490-Hanusia_phi.AAC.1